MVMLMAPRAARPRNARRFNCDEASTIRRLSYKGHAISELCTMFETNPTTIAHILRYERAYRNDPMLTHEELVQEED